MGIIVESTDIDSISIKHREENDTSYGYAVVHLKRNVAPVSVFHFNFSMLSADFHEQLNTLQEASDKSGFHFETLKKSRLGLRVEMALAGALAGLEYRNHACPSCRMIDAFFSSR